MVRGYGENMRRELALILLIIFLPAINFIAFMQSNEGNFHDGENFYNNITGENEYGAQGIKLLYPLTIFGKQVFFYLMAYLPFIIFTSYLYITLNRLDLAYIFTFLPFGYISLGWHSQIIAMLFMFIGIHLWFRHKDYLVGAAAFGTTYFCHKTGYALMFVFLAAIVLAHTIRMRLWVLKAGIACIFIFYPLTNLMPFWLNAGSISLFTHYLISAPLLLFYLIYKEANATQLLVLLFLLGGAISIPFVYGSPNGIESLHTGWRVLAMLDVVVLLFLGLSTKRLTKKAVVYFAVLGLTNIGINIYNFIS